MRAYNFGGSGRNLTKFYQGMWLIGGVHKDNVETNFTRGAPTKVGRVRNVKIQRNF